MHCNRPAQGQGHLATYLVYSVPTRGTPGRLKGRDGYAPFIAGVTGPNRPCIPFQTQDYEICPEPVDRVEDPLPAHEEIFVNTLLALTPHHNYGELPSRPRQTVDEITDILRQVNDVTAVPSLSPFNAIYTHDRTAFGDEHILRLSEILELVGHSSMIHVVGRREILNRFFVALAAIARVLSFSHGRSLSGCLSGKPPFPAELATSGSQPLKLVSETLLHVPLNPRLQIQRSGRIEGA